MRKSLVLSLFAIAATAGAANAQVWAEIPDAPAAPPAPQMTVGVGPLIDITGALGGPGDVDSYCIDIFAPTSFGAWTNGAPPFAPGTLGPAGATFDSQLWLFKDMGGGLFLPIMHSDDTDFAVGGGTLSGMGFAQPNPIVGPPPPLPIFTPGRYMISISRFDFDALDPAGIEIWADVPFPGWSGPDGPAPAGPLGSWTGGGAGGPAGDPYHIVLAGAFFCEVPAPSTAGLLGLAGLVAFRRRR